MSNPSRQEIIEAIRIAGREGNDAAVRKLSAMLDAPQARTSAPPRGWSRVEDKPAGASPPRKSGTGNILADSASAVGGALWRGIAPVADLFAAGGEAVTDGVSNVIAGTGDAVLRAGGFPNAAQSFTNFVAPPRRPARLRLNDVPDQLGTPRPQAPGLETTANILGGMLLPGPKLPAPVPKLNLTPKPVTVARVKPPRVIADAAEVVAEGARRNVPVYTTDVAAPRTFLGKLARRTGEIIPFAGTGGQRAAQQTARVEATKEFIADYGVTGLDDIFAGRGSLVDDVAENLTATRGGRLKALTSQKKAVMTQLDNAGPVRAPQTIREIQKQINHLSGINKEAYAPVIKELQDFGMQLMQGKTLNQIEGNRRILGAMFKRPELAAIADDGQKAVNAIYGPLRADMGNFIRAKGGDAAFNRWKQANDALSGMAGELRSNALKSVLRNADMTPEAAGKLLFSSKPSDVARLYANLDNAGRAKGRAALIQRAAEVASRRGDDINPDTFIKGIKDLGSQFGIFFKGAERSELEGFNRLIRATAHAPEAGVMVNTGAQNLPAVTSVALTQAFGLVGGIMSGGGIGLMARAYESAPVRNALMRLGQIKPGTQSYQVALSNVERLITPLAVTFSRELNEAANVNTAARLAAAPGDQKQQEQQTVP